MTKLTEIAGSVLAGAIAALFSFGVLALTSVGDMLHGVHSTLPYALLAFIMIVVTILVYSITVPAITLKIGKFKWSRNDFCRGWFVVGVTGAGKTFFITKLIRLLNEREGPKGKNKKWGGLYVDEKGLYWETLEEIFKSQDREEDLKLLQVKPTWETDSWKPQWRMNLIANEALPSSSFTEAIMEVSRALADGNAGDPFWEEQAQIKIGVGIDFLRALRAAQLEAGVPSREVVTPALDLVYDILTDKAAYDALLERTGFTSPSRVRKGGSTQSSIRFDKLNSPALREHLSHLESKHWGAAPNQLSGVKGNITNALHYFKVPEVARVFCRDTNITVADVENGSVLAVSMPSVYEKEKRCVYAILKMMVTQQIRSRGDRTKKARKGENLVVILQDEAQKMVQNSDLNVDILREFNGTMIIGTQFVDSLYDALGGKEKANVLLYNLRNWSIGSCANEETAEICAKFIGKYETFKTTSSHALYRGVTHSVSKQEDFRVSPARLRELPDMQTVIVHSKRKRGIFWYLPTEGNGKAKPWWRKSAPFKVNFFNPFWTAPHFVQVSSPKAKKGM